MKKPPQIFFLCYPHIGTLDNWMSIINSINNRVEHVKFTLIVPNVTILRAFHKDNAVISMSNDIFNTILMHAYGEKWVESESLHDSIKWYQSNKVILRAINVFNNLIRRYKYLFFLSWLINLLHNKIYNGEEVFKSKNIDKIVSLKDILLYDIGTEGKVKASVVNILQLFENNKKYSLPHAVTIKAAIQKEYPLGVNINYVDNIKIYVHSECQIEFYKNSYNSNTGNIRLIGIPRHDRIWMKKIQEESPKLPDNFNNKNTIVVISKRLSHGLSFNEKKQTLKDIKDIFVDKLGMHVVAKLHPTEVKERIYSNKLDTIYEDVFGSNNYGVTWIYSDIHQIALCNKKPLVVSLGGSVALDVIALGVPCVQYKNKKENSESQFVKYGFVTGVSNYYELKNYVKKLNKEPDKISKISEETYNSFFPSFGDISITIADEILDNSHIK